ncbi:MAG: hypothetical protein WBB25_02505 [Sulfitobacter sp.]
MAKHTTPNPPPKTGKTREDRLKAALKANMARRKAQTRARAAQNTADNEGKDTPMKGE